MRPKGKKKQNVGCENGETDFEGLGRCPDCDTRREYEGCAEGCETLDRWIASIRWPDFGRKTASEGGA